MPQLLHARAGRTDRRMNFPRVGNVNTDGDADRKKQKQLLRKEFMRPFT